MIRAQSRGPLGVALSLLFGALFAPSINAQVEPDAVLLRYPDVSSDRIVFRYDGDLWILPKSGGEARRITSAPGNESFPKFSPDGESVAFMGGYDGGTDLYTLRIGAGAPERITHHPTTEILNDWTPEGDGLLYWSGELSGLGRSPRIFEVSASGGQPAPLPVPYGTFGSVDASGTWLAYTMGSREFRTWKRYQGGLAQDVWLFNLKTNESRQITDHPGTDAAPMWTGREVVFLSDRSESGRMNLFAYDLDSGETRALTDYTDVDVKFPSMGPEDLVYEAGGKLFRYVLASGESVPVRVVIPGERPSLRPKSVDAAPFLMNATASPKGVRLAVTARGEIFSVPADEGITRNLTRTDGVAERGATWSPDGRWIAYFSDRSGEYELTLRSHDGKTFEGADENGERKLTSVGAGWKSNILWAPCSEKICFSTNDGGLHVVDVESGALTTVHTNPDGSPLTVDWSNDSNWLAFSHRHPESRLSAVFLYDLGAGELHAVTSGMFHDSNPRFDKDGDWLWFASNRTFSPIYEDFGTTWIYTNSSNLMAVPLRADVENPWAPKNDEVEIDEEEDEESEEDDAAEGESEAAESSEETDSDEGESSEENGSDDGEEDAGGEGDADGEDAESGDDATDADEDGEEAEEGEEEEEEDDSLEIELSGFEARAILLPVDAGQLGNLEGGKGKLLFQRSPRTGSSGGSTSLHFYDMGEKEEKKVLDSFSGGYVMFTSGEKLLVYGQGGKLGIVDVAPGQKFEAVDLSDMTATIDPRAEWPQLLADVYRLYRDFFYEDGLHGVDWAGIHKRYTAALRDATSRADVHMFIGEMIAELNVGHAYNSAPTGGFESSGPARPVGLLGCDWELEGGAYRVARILGDAGAYDADARSPLARHGVDVSVGDYLLEVNGIPVDASQNVYAAFVGTAGKATELTVNASATLDGEERRVLVKPMASDSGLRYRDWVSRLRARVEEKGGGRIGYVHVPDTGIRGQNELFRQFHGQMHKDALIVDERWNGGGQIPTRFIELLDRPLTNYWAIRAGEDWDWPPVGHRGPKAMLINGWSGSGGDAFPYYFRQAGLGKLIGRRTWGGLVGISGNPGLIDGASPTVPRFAFYELDGTWGVEGHGVAPDIDVLDDPALMVDGGDPQLDVAIEHLLEELEGWTFETKARPANPDRSGTGITAEDK